MVQCPLCGLEFKIKDSLNLCKKCPLALKCKLVKCPNCGYEFPLVNNILKLRSVLWKRRRVKMR